MKTKSKISNKSRTAFLMCCLLLQSQFSICQDVSLKPGQVQKIVKELQVCELMAVEIKLVKDYNISLKKQLESEVAKHKECKQGKAMSSRKLQRWRRVAFAVGTACLLETVLILRL